ncbi:MAG: hypothetical protein QM749_09205 [Aquabacterium sp.]
MDELLLYIAPVLLGERARPLFDGLHIDAMTERLQMRAVDSRRHRRRPAPAAASCAAIRP